MTPVRSISPAGLRDWRASGQAFVLLDVREAPERARASLPGTLDVPMRDVPARMAELPKGEPIVVLCHYGERSAHVASFLAANGFDDVYNLAGGIDAYAEEIDPAVARY